MKKQTLALAEMKPLNQKNHSEHNKCSHFSSMSPKQEHNQDPKINGHGLKMVVWQHLITRDFWSYNHTFINNETYYLNSGLWVSSLKVLLCVRLTWNHSPFLNVRV